MILMNILMMIIFNYVVTFYDDLCVWMSNYKIFFFGIGK